MSASGAAAAAGGPRARLVHLTTTDMSLDWLLRPQLEAFARAGYEVVAMSAPGPHVAALEAAGIRHVALRNATRAMDLRRDAAAFVELLGAFRRLAPEIVHTHNPKPGVYGRVAARLAGVPAVVNTQHGLYAVPDDPWPRRAAVYLAERLAAGCADAELVQNPEDLEQLARLGVPRARLHLLGNGIDLRRFDPAAVDPSVPAALRRRWGVRDDEVVALTVGRLVREKGIGEVLDAAGRLRGRSPAVRVVVVGPDDDAKADAVPPAVRRRATAECGVVFAGEHHDMPAVYAAADLFVLASHREGWPRSAMEAAAMGLPVVATDVRGCREVVEDGRTGVLVPVGDAAALSGAVAALAAADDRRGAMGRAGRALAAERFDQTQVIERTLAVYASLRCRARPAAAPR